MNNLLKWLNQLEFRQLVWILPTMWLLHEAEEWNILAWYKRYWVNIPDITRITVWTWLIFISICGFVWTFLATLSRNPKVTALAIFPFFTFFAFANALQHIYFLYYFRAYNPGVATAVILVIPGMLYVTLRALQANLIPWWYVVIVNLPIIPAIGTVIRTGNEVPAIIHGIYGFSARLAKMLWGIY